MGTSNCMVIKYPFCVWQKKESIFLGELFFFEECAHTFVHTCFSTTGDPKSNVRKPAK